MSITAWLLLLRPACAVTLKATRRGDRGLKAINNLMLSGPCWRKRMQLYVQGPGLRQMTELPSSLWGPTWKTGVRGRGIWGPVVSLFFFGVLSPKQRVNYATPAFLQEPPTPHPPPFIPTPPSISAHLAQVKNTVRCYQCFRSSAIWWWIFALYVGWSLC